MADYQSLMVSTAQKYIGTAEPKGDDQFITAYNKTVGTSFNMETAWCAIFVTYCARMAGVPTTVIPNFASCTVSIDTFWKPKGLWKLQTSGYTPKPGDLIYYDWSGNRKTAQHVGIVKQVSGNNVITIEGNTSNPAGKTQYDGVYSKTYAKSSKYIFGYAAVNYPSSSSSASATETKVSSMVKNTYIGNYQTWLNKTYNSGLNVDGECGPKTKTESVKAWQKYANATVKANLAVDGAFGPLCQKAGGNNKLILKKNSRNNLVYILQGILYCHGYDPKGIDGEMGTNTVNAVKAFQKARSLEVDGEVGTETWTSLFNKW